jgi:hypothetical protein
MLPQIASLPAARNDRETWMHNPSGITAGAAL